MKLTILALPFLFITYFSFGQTNLQIVSIRESVQLINTEKGYYIKTLTNEYFTDVKNEDSDNGQELKGYYKSGKLKKIVYTIGLSNCMKTYEYYFSDSGLIFMFEKEDDFPIKSNGSELDYTKAIPAYEGRFYFENGKLLQTIIKGKERSGEPNKDKFTTDLKVLLDDLKSYKNN